MMKTSLLKGCLNIMVGLAEGHVEYGGTKCGGTRYGGFGRS
jgi:hypothetical protein